MIWSSYFPRLNFETWRFFMSQTQRWFIPSKAQGWFLLPGIHNDCTVTQLSIIQDVWLPFSSSFLRVWNDQMFSVLSPPLPPPSRNTYIPNLLLHTFANTPRVFPHPIISVSSSTFASSTRAHSLFPSRAKSHHRPTCRNSRHAAQFGTKCPLCLFLMHSSRFKRK